MALFEEEQITDTLDTGVPSIKYEGNEGPQDPRQEQMLAQLKEEYMQYVFEQKDLGEPIMSFEEWYQAVYEASKMGVQAPQEQMGMQEEMMMREPAAYGGIMDLDSGRRMYGFGSFFKKITKIPRKLVKGAKKLVKSDLGKAALTAAAMYYGGGALGGLGGSSTAASSAGPWTMFKQGPAKKGLGALFKKAIPHLTNPKTLAKIGIGAASALPFLGIGTQKQQDQLPDAQGGKFDYNYRDMRNRFAKAETEEDFAAAEKEFPVTPNLFKSRFYDMAADGGRIGYQGGEMVEGMAEGVEKVGRGGSEIIEKIKEGIMEGGDRAMGIPGIDEAIWIEKIKDFIRKKRGDPREEMTQEEIIEQLRPRDPMRPLPSRPRDPMPMQSPMRPMPEDMPRRGYALGSKADFAIEDVMTGGMEDEIGGITGIMRQADLQRKGNVGQFYAAEGGSPKEGGIMDLGGMEKDYRNTGGFVELGEEEKADDVPARLSKNEFVMTADAVRGAGDGDIDKGAEVMEKVMKNLEKGGRISKESQGLEGAQEMFDVSERLSEVVV